MRHHRAEHWVVVRGTARAMIGDNVTFLHENKSTYVLSGARHRLENPGKIGLELIEVQTGSYLGEDASRTTITGREHGQYTTAAPAPMTRGLDAVPGVRTAWTSPDGSLQLPDTANTTPQSTF
jgi:hypothetical protein